MRRSKGFGFCQTTDVGTTQIDDYLLASIGTGLLFWQILPATALILWASKALDHSAYLTSSLMLVGRSVSLLVFAVACVTAWRLLKKYRVYERLDSRHNPRSQFKWGLGLGFWTMVVFLGVAAGGQLLTRGGQGYGAFGIGLSILIALITMGAILLNVIAVGRLAWGLRYLRPVRFDRGTPVARRF